MILPFVQTMRLVDMREQVVDVPPQEVITSDNVVVSVDASHLLRAERPQRLIYNVANFPAGHHQAGPDQPAQPDRRHGARLCPDLARQHQPRPAPGSSTTPPTSGACGSPGSRSSASTRRTSWRPCMHEQMKAERTRRAVVTTADGQREGGHRPGRGPEVGQHPSGRGPQQQKAILDAQGQPRPPGRSPTPRSTASSPWPRASRGRPQRLRHYPRGQPHARPAGGEVPRGAAGHRQQPGHQDLPARRHVRRDGIDRRHRRAVQREGGRRAAAGASRAATRLLGASERGTERPWGSGNGNKGFHMAERSAHEAVTTYFTEGRAVIGLDDELAESAAQLLPRDRGPVPLRLDDGRPAGHPRLPGAAQRLARPLQGRHPLPTRRGTSTRSGPLAAIELEDGAGRRAPAAPRAGCRRPDRAQPRGVGAPHPPLHRRHQRPARRVPGHPGSDVNTNAQVMAWMMDEWGDLNGYEAAIVTGKPVALGGARGAQPPPRGRLRLRARGLRRGAPVPPRGGAGRRPGLPATGRGSPASSSLEGARSSGSPT